MINDSMDELLRELATRHHVLIGRDDPIMMLVTIQEHMLKLLQEGQHTALADFQSSMERIMTNWSEDAREKAQRIVNGSLEASKRILNQNVESISNSIASEVGKVFDRRMTELETKLTEVRAEKKANYLMVVGFSGFALLVAVGSLLIK